MDSVRSNGFGMNTDSRGLVALSLAWILILAVGCAPKRVTRQGGPENPAPPAETPAKSLPALPPVIEGDAPDPTGSAAELPDPRVRVASGPSREGTETPRPPGVPDGDLGAQAAGLARDQLGKQYQWGASGPDKFDCSGLVMYVYSELGVPLPRVSREQASAGVHIDRPNLQPGDLVFFKLNGSRIDHVGIYVGRNDFVHAPRRYMPVRKDSLNNAYWRKRYMGARRVG